MKSQFKYSFLEHMTRRGIVISAVVVMNLVFGFMGYYDVYGQGWKITAVTLCSIALCGILVLCVITDFETLGGICSAPAGYATLLIPVSSWKVILPRVVIILVEDLIFISAGIVGVVVQSFILSDVSWDVFFNDSPGKLPLLWMLILIVLTYVNIILVSLFCIVLSKSVFSSIKAGAFLAVLATAGVVYALSLLDFLLVPFGTVRNVGMFYSIQLQIGANAGMFGFILLSLCRAAALFLTCSYLMERKINV